MSKVVTLGSLQRSVEAYINGRRVLGLEICQTQALQLHPIVAGADPSSQGSIHGFCPRIAYFHRLERQQI